MLLREFSYPADVLPSVAIAKSLYWLSGQYNLIHSIAHPTGCLELPYGILCICTHICTSNYEWDTGRHSSIEDTTGTIGT